MLLHVSCNAGAGTIGYRLKSHLKRYWAVDLWQTFFDTLLQPSDPVTAPPCAELLLKVEIYLQSQPGVAKKLQADLIKTQELRR